MGRMRRSYCHGGSRVRGAVDWGMGPGQIVAGPFTFPDIKALCQDAMANRAGWLRLRISQDSEATQSNLIKFDSSDATTASTRPKLSVAW